MTAIDEIIASLESVTSELNNAGGSTTTAINEADEAIAAANALGAAQVVAGLSSVKEVIEKVMQQVRAASEAAGEAVNLAKAIAEGT
jgi:nicotinate-nucleotide pyrophosphorylase